MRNQQLEKKEDAVNLLIDREHVRFEKGMVIVDWESIVDLGSNEKRAELY